MTARQCSPNRLHRRLYVYQVARAQQYLVHSPVDKGVKFGTRVVPRADWGPRADWLPALWFFPELHSVLKLRPRAGRLIQQVKCLQVSLTTESDT